MSDSTRFSAHDAVNRGLVGVPSGYEGLKNTGLTVPPNGVMDVDKAVVNLFEAQVPLVVSTSEGLKRVPVILAGGEKWAMLKQGKALRDQNGSLILPLVTIVKGDMEQSFASDISGRGSNQQTGEIRIKRRLSNRDRGYQNLINKLGVKNQLNVATVDATDPQLFTLNAVGGSAEEPDVVDGGFLAGNRKDNIWEIITVPTPQYVTLTYEVTIWTQYQQQMNQILEALVTSYLPQTRGWKLTTDCGYWFIANVSSDEYKADDNSKESTGLERIIKRVFSVSVPTFVLASDTPGAPVPVKRYVSAPIVSFDMGEGTELASDEVEEAFLGADDPTLPSTLRTSARADERDTRHGRIFPARSTVNDADPALSTARRGRTRSVWKRATFRDRTGNTVVRNVRVRYTGGSGEMTIDRIDPALGGLTLVALDD